MGEVIEFVNRSQIKIIETNNFSFRAKRCKMFMTQEDLDLLWYLNEVYTNENTES